MWIKIRFLFQKTHIPSSPHFIFHAAHKIIAQNLDKHYYHTAPVHVQNFRFHALYFQKNVFPETIFFISRKQFSNATLHLAMTLRIYLNLQISVLIKQLATMKYNFE